MESDAARQLRIKMQTAIDLLKKRQSKVLSIFFKGRKEILRKIIASTMEIDKCHKRVTRTCPLAVEADRNNIDSSLRVLEELNERHTHSTESRTRIVSTNTNRGSSGGGHGTTIGGGGFSGHSGKF